MDQEAKGTERIPELLGRLGEELTRLAAQQWRLAVHEVQLQVGVAIKIALLSVFLILLTIVALIITSFTVAVALHELASWPLWASYGGVSILLFLVVAIIGFVIRCQLARFHLLPLRTLHTLKEDTQWIKEQLISLKT